MDLTIKTYFKVDLSSFIPLLSANKMFEKTYPKSTFKQLYYNEKYREKVESFYKISISLAWIKNELVGVVIFFHTNDLPRTFSVKTADTFMFLGFLDVFVKDKHRNNKIGSKLVSSFEREMFIKYKDKSNYFVINCLDIRAFKLIKENLNTIIPSSGGRNYFKQSHDVRKRANKIKDEFVVKAL